MPVKLATKALRREDIQINFLREPLYIAVFVAVSYVGKFNVNEIPDVVSLPNF
jgi:hypothetical protein